MGDTGALIPTFGCSVVPRLQGTRGCDTARRQKRRQFVYWSVSLRYGWDEEALPVAATWR